MSGKSDDTDGNRPDDYEDVALIFVGFMCDACGDELLDVPGWSDPNSPGWNKAIGEYAKSLGWLVRLRGGKLSDWLILCPKCSTRLRDHADELVKLSWTEIRERFAPTA